ncbi:MAG: DUF262 domain-containing protein [Terriglobales bacterium]|jgi:hypothetical protein
MPSLLEQYRISDFLDWHRQKRLELNPDFQRGSVWTPAARTFLIDTILRQLPVPKVYLRTKINVATKKSVREVVDGQQRLRAIIDFAENKFSLSKRASEFVGKRYSDLTEEQQEAFLSYPIAVDQLVNASIDDVLEVFARLNSYTVSLNGPEKRHAKWQGDFKWAIRAASRKWASLWEDYKVLTVRERVRMLDDSLTAEMVGILLDGIKDGGQPKIDALYKKYDKVFDTISIKNLDKTLKYFVQNLAERLIDTPLMNPPHLLMLFGGLAHILIGIPPGDLTPGEFAKLPRSMAKDLDRVRDNLLLLGAIVDGDAEPAEPYAEFWKASRSSTQRIASRRVRFPFYVRALSSDNL